MNPQMVSEVRTLIRPQQAPCISIFVPPQPAGERIQTATRWKNLVREARSLLSTRYAKREAEELLSPLDRIALWSDGSEVGRGLAVFRSPAIQLEYWIPAPFPEMVVVSDTFHTRPLVRYFNTKRRFFLLALAQSSVTLFEGTSTGLARLDVEGLPRDLRQIIGRPSARRYLGVHGDMGHGSAPTFHGHSTEALEGLVRYFRAIDRAVWQLLRSDPGPLILAGVAKHHSLYRSVSRIPDLLDEGIDGNVERVSSWELHRRAMMIVENYARETRGALLARLESALVSGRAATDLHEVANAAVRGRVRVLLHAQGKHIWGKLDRMTGEMEIREKQLDAEDGELLDDLSETVLLHGGDVFEVPGSALPDQSPVAALYRY
jgi:hypothetical protein